jgi:hypothetical protein
MRITNSNSLQDNDVKGCWELQKNVLNTAIGGCSWQMIKLC